MTLPAVEGSVMAADGEGVEFFGAVGAFETFLVKPLPA